MPSFCAKVGVIFGAKFEPDYVQCCEKIKKVVVIEIPEWKLIAKSARNTIFEGN